MQAASDSINDSTSTSYTVGKREGLRLSAALVTLPALVLLTTTYLVGIYLGFTIATQEMVPDMPRQVHFYDAFQKGGKELVCPILSQGDSFKVSRYAVRPDAVKDFTAFHKYLGQGCIPQ